MTIFKNAQKLENEELKEVSGGYILDRNLEPGDVNYSYRWAVVDKEGYILQCFGSKEAAENYCRPGGSLFAKEITWEEYQELIENRKQ